MAEFFDPVGWWEPLRLQMKLSFQELNALDWKDPVPESSTETWVGHFRQLEEAQNLTIPVVSSLMTLHLTGKCA